MIGCDFCLDPNAEVVEFIGDNGACRNCIQPDGLNLCDECGKPLMVLDHGGTLLMDSNTYICERCWVS
jgi:hypothetical protein